MTPSEARSPAFKGFHTALGSLSVNVNSWKFSKTPEEFVLKCVALRKRENTEVRNVEKNKKIIKVVLRAVSGTRANRIFETRQTDHLLQVLRSY